MPRLSLDELFVEWLNSYPEPARPEFYRDGIVDEEVYAKQRSHVLFILAEPNGTKRNYDACSEPDLREIFGQRGLGKSIDLNLARWTSVVLNRTREFFTPTREEAKQVLQMAAVMNLKKLAGGGRANVEAISVQAWRDREFIRREVDIIQPSVILSCGVTASRLFSWLVNGDELKAFTPTSTWWWHHVPVLPVNHPSIRPKDAGPAFLRVVALVEKLEQRT